MGTLHPLLTQTHFPPSATVSLANLAPQPGPPAGPVPWERGQGCGHKSVLLVKVPAPMGQQCPSLLGETGVHLPKGSRCRWGGG